MEFRANFFAKLLHNIAWIGFFLLMVLVIFSNTSSIAGWTRGEAFVLASTCFMVYAICYGLFMGLMEIPQQVRNGTLDFVVTKPIDTQFWVSSRKASFENLGTLIVGIALTFLGLYMDNVRPGGLQWMAYAIIVLSACVIFYAFMMSLMTLGIFLVRVENLWVLGDTVFQVARYPADIYGAGLQRFLTFVVPISMLATVPSRQLVRGFNGTMLGIAVLWAVGAFLISRAFWRYALKHYTSASS